MDEGLAVSLLAARNQPGNKSTHLSYRLKVHVLQMLQQETSDPDVLYCEFYCGAALLKIHKAELKLYSSSLGREKESCLFFFFSFRFIKKTHLFCRDSRGSWLPVRHYSTLNLLTHLLTTQKVFIHRSAEAQEH